MSSKTLLALRSLLVPLLAAQDRSKPARIDVENYAIDAEINPRTQALSANGEGPLDRFGQRHLLRALSS